MSSTNTAAIKLYRNLLRAGKNWKDYNFSQYSQRRVREEFRANRNAAVADVPKLMEKGRENLALIQRQALIGSLYTMGNSVVSKSL